MFVSVAGPFSCIAAWPLLECGRHESSTRSVPVPLLAGAAAEYEFRFETWLSHCDEASQRMCHALLDSAAIVGGIHACSH